MNDLFQQLKAVTDLPHGWTSYEKAKTLAGIILALRPACVVEIGVWSGRGTIACALALKEVGHGKCYGIDPYDPAASAEGQTGENLAWWSKQDHEFMYRYCLDQIRAFIVEDYAEIVRKRSDDVEPHTLPNSIGLLVCDGNHGPQAVKDVQRFAPRVHVGGFIVMDDLHWQDGGVSQGVDYLLANGFSENYRVNKPGDDWAVFQRVKPHKEKK